MMGRFRVFGAILLVLPLSMSPFFKARADSGVFGLTAAILCALPDTVLASVVPGFLQHNSRRASIHNRVWV